MIEKDFVPYEESFELDKLDFDEPCFGWYVSETYGMEIGRVSKDDLINDAVLAPTYSQAFRFFRDKHNINAQIAFCEYSVSSENSWKFTFDNPTNVLIWNGKFNTYEEAELECLKVLIEMVKTK
jgi:hypothetical protein